jgi:putative ABC transport system permease protein
LPLSEDGHRLDSRSIRIIGRLKEGRSPLVAGQEVGTLIELPADGKIQIVSLHDQLTANVRPAFRLLNISTGIIFLLVCANALALLLARNMSRARELAIRVTLGAGRWRLAGESLLEGLTISGIAGLLAAATSYWWVEGFVCLFPSLFPRLDEVEVTGRSLISIIGLSLVAGLVLGS